MKEGNLNSLAGDTLTQGKPGKCFPLNNGTEFRDNTRGNKTPLMDCELKKSKLNSHAGARNRI
eukprot:12193662-Karenia_brevis.AAC.1